MAAHLQQENDDPPDQISNRNIWSSNSSTETMNTKSQKKAINSILRLETCFKARFFSSFLFCFFVSFLRGWGGWGILSKWNVISGYVTSLYQSQT